MVAMEVRLPGGLPGNGGVERNARFRLLTGHLELALSELDRRVSKPAYVSAALALAIESIGGGQVGGDAIAALCPADRQFLMLRLGALLAGEQQWIEVTCAHCLQTFDVEFRRCDLPMKEAGEGFPEGRVTLDRGEVEFRLPTAADQVTLSRLSDAEAMRHLLLRCIRSVNGVPPTPALVEALTAAEIGLVEEAMEHLSPAICDGLLVTCPECMTEQNATLDHTRLPGIEGGAFYNEVHSLASHYHWAESEILNMPRSRRHRYLGLIDRSRAVSSQGE